MKGSTLLDFYKTINNKINFTRLLQQVWFIGIYANFYASIYLIQILMHLIEKIPSLSIKIINDILVRKSVIKTYTYNNFCSVPSLNLLLSHSPSRFLCVTYRTTYSSEINKNQQEECKD